LKKLIVTFLMTSLVSIPSGASMFGEENAALYQILAQAIQQLAQLRAILANAQDTLGLLQDINRGINDSLSLLQTISPNLDPGIYREWLMGGDAIQKLQAIYGIVVPSPDYQVERDTDQNVAEAVTLNNSIYDYTKQIDLIGEEVKKVSHQVSPGGAQKLTAETLGVMLHVMNQSLRTQATGLKLQAQSLAVQNHKDKEKTKHLITASQDLEGSLKTEDPKFEFPRF